MAKIKVDTVSIVSEETYWDEEEQKTKVATCITYCLDEVEARELLQDLQTRNSVKKLRYKGQATYRL